MEHLTKVEEIVLLAIWKLEGNSYGYNVRKYVLNVFKKEFTIGHLYSVLNQLERKGFVSKSVGESTERRRGKPKIYYTVNKEGIDALKEARRAYNLIWNQIPKRAFETVEN